MRELGNCTKFPLKVLFVRVNLPLLTITNPSPLGSGKREQKHCANVVFVTSAVLPWPTPMAAQHPPQPRCIVLHKRAVRDDQRAGTKIDTAGTVCAIAGERGFRDRRRASPHVEATDVDEGSVVGDAASGHTQNAI